MKHIKDAIAEHSKPFQYGESDCAQFANSVQKNITGIDYKFDYSEREMVAQISAQGLTNVIRDIIKQEPINDYSVLMAGDPVIVVVGDTDLMGVKVDQDRIAIKTEKHLSMIKSNRFVCGWSLCQA